MKEKVIELGRLVREIELNDPQFLKKLIQSQPQRFMHGVEEFLATYTKITEKAIQLDLDPVILQASDAVGVYEKTEFKHLFFSGHSEPIITEERLRIGQKIASLRAEKSISQHDLAALTNLLQPNIARIEKGKYSVGSDLLIKIGLALDVKLDFI